MVHAHAMQASTKHNKTFLIFISPHDFIASASLMSCCPAQLRDEAS
jgi:hypothetical protein